MLCSSVFRHAQQAAVRSSWWKWRDQRDHSTSYINALDISRPSSLVAVSCGRTCHRSLPAHALYSRSLRAVHRPTAGLHSTQGRFSERAQVVQGSNLCHRGYLVLRCTTRHYDLLLAGYFQAAQPVGSVSEQLCRVHAQGKLEEHHRPRSGGANSTHFVRNAPPDSLEL